MTSFERATVRHIARTAYSGLLRRYGQARAETAAREQVDAFIADLDDTELQTALRRDLETFLAEQRQQG